jgi:4-hydroxy-tetrahydrodipicolinate reductase
MNRQIKLAVAGCTGKMGRLVVQEIMAAPDLLLTAGSTRVGSPYSDKDVGELIGSKPIGINITSAPQTLFKEADCVIDFSHPYALTEHLDLAVLYGKPMVVAVTGLTEDHKRQMLEASPKCPLLYAPNTSLGITLLLSLVEQVARALPDSFDVDVVEIHHRHKKDAPSGTSLALGQAIKKGKEGQNYADYYYPLPAQELRPTSTIGYSVSRSGGFPGDHSVVFASEGEVIELKHRSFNRQIYAQGALKAARWLIHQQPGLYSMKDVLAK